MRASVKVLLAAAILGLSTASVSAQAQILPAKPGFAAKRIAIVPGGANSYYLLNQKAVQEDLKLTKEQLKKYQDADKAQAQARTEFYKTLRGGGGNRAEAQKKMQAAMKKFNEVMKKLLTKEQTKRIDQIQFQQQTRYGLYSVFNKFSKWGKELKVTDEQVKKFRNLQRETSKEYRNLPKGLAREDLIKARNKIRDDSNKKAKELLTKEQQKKFDEMKGKPFKGLGGPIGIRPIPRPLPLPVRPIKPGKIQIQPGKRIQIKGVRIKGGKIQILPAKPVNPTDDE